jgi:Polyketide cyclase / dehydrase and lipid transport
MFLIRERQHTQPPSRRLFAALTAIIGLSFFISRVDADNAAQASTEVQWPTGYSPRNADLFTHDEVVIHASHSTVWNYLVAAEQWPSWYSNSHNVKILNSEHILRPGSTFTWTTFGVRLQSTVAEFVRTKRLGWYNMHLDGSGIRSYHAWLLIPVAEGCRLISESTELGPNISSSVALIRQGRRFQLNRIKAVSESHQ